MVASRPGGGRSRMTLFARVLWTVVVGGLALYYGVCLVMIAVAAQEFRRQRWLPKALRLRVALESGALEGVSVVVPAHNEEVSIERTVTSILRACYSDLEVIVVSDGSTDRTLSVLAYTFALRPSNRRASGELPTQAVREVFESAADPRLI